MTGTNQKAESRKRNAESRHRLRLSALGFRLAACGRLVLCLALFAGLAACAALATDADALRRKQQAQEKARTLAGELISGVLDIQLRQLEENGLQGLPIYRDIASMKGTIHGLMTSDMEAIVQLLTEAQEGPQEARLAKFNAARGKIREVVVQLMAQRHKLYRRMQVARLAADTRQLIALQSKAWSITRSLPQHKPIEREALALATVEDQADVQKLFYQLLAALQDVSTWGGQAGAGAADGLRILKAAQVDPELKKAGETLGKADFPEATKSQHAVVKGLTALLDRLNEAQGLEGGDREEALRLVRLVREKQQNLRERTRQSELTERTTEPLIEQQTGIQKELGKLAEALTKFPRAEPLVDEAKAASFEATANLFEEKKPPALDEQNRVIGSLAQIEKVLEQGLDLERSSKSADELAAEVQRLAELKKQLEGIAQRQLQASQLAAQIPQQAAQHEKIVAAELAKTDALGDLSSAVAARLTDAKEKVGQAQAELDRSAPEAAQLRTEATHQAQAAIQQAQAEVEAQLADTMRRQKAVEVGELARAAEALERAAAAEREVAGQTGDAAKQDGLSLQKAEALAAEQKDIAEVAQKIAAGVQNTAPAASEILAQARPPIDEAGRQLEAAGEQPGDASKPAAEKASESAQQAAEQLTEAAAELRRRQGRAAGQLEKIAGEQLLQAERARQAVEKAAEMAKVSAAEAISRLQQARQKVGEAVAEQATAEGKGQEAAARQLTERIAEAIREQDDADHAARDVARGKSNNPLHAASKQQEVADLAGELARQSPAEVARPLGQTAKAAAEAARETLGGSPPKAETARDETRQSLAQAMRAAQQMAKAAAEAPPGQPDAASQSQAGKKAGEAQQLVRQAASAAGPPAQEAGELLGQAQQYAAAAKQNIDGGNAAQAQDAQGRVDRALATAAEKIDQALHDLANQQAAGLAQQARQTGQLTEQAAQIDPGAAAALQQAQAAAQQGAQAPGQPSQAVQAQQEVQRNMEQAQANLAARAQQLRRDRDLAQTLAELATTQQTARDAIAQAAEQLEKISQAARVARDSVAESPSPRDGPHVQQLAAAQALQQAQQQFAAAQQATGEGAAEVSGQQEVANQPIREGLEVASRLNQQGRDGIPTEGQPASEGQPMGQAQPAGQGQPAGQRPPMGQGQPAQGQPSDRGQPGSQGQPSQLGTGFVPASPQVTAQQIAGPQANAAAASAMAAAASAAQGQGQGEQPGQGEGKSQTPVPGAASSTAKKGGAAKGGKTATNQEQQPGDLQTAQAPDADSRGELVNQDANSGGLKVEREPWFAKLPASLRAAIQARARGKAPRGYEERLRRYFESVD